VSFTGFPAAALDFYDDLEMDNTRSFWEANKTVHSESVLAPMKALAASLEPEFGAAKVFRPHRDVRFAKDKTPYKTHQGAFVGVAPATGWYVEVSARGVRTGAGFYHADAPTLAAFRDAIVDDAPGARLERILTKLEKGGYEVSGEQLKTAPRGYDKEHPRIGLLRHKQLFAGRMIGFEPVIHTAELADVVRQDWRAYKPLIDWLARLAPAQARP
jgi:uncharacterized protein (TIGR02453 family)